MMRAKLAVLALAAALAFPSAASAITRGNFANGVTNRLGDTVTLHTRRAFMAENQAEGRGGANNAYNTTQVMPFSTLFNSAGVQNYSTGREGEEATVKTLHYRHHGYWRILQALKNNAPAITIVRAFGKSDWGTDLSLVEAVLRDIQHDRYPNTLANLEAQEIPGINR